MITRIQIQNFRSIEYADVTLENLTVMVGRNGAGKSAFVDALRFLSDAVSSGLGRAIDERGGIERLRKWDANGLADLIIAVWVRDNRENDDYIYKIVIESLSDNEWRIRSEGCWRDMESKANQVFLVEDGQWVVKEKGLFSTFDIPPELNELTLPKTSLIDHGSARLAWYLKEIRCYSIFPLDVLRAPQIASKRPSLNADGTNLAPQLLDIQGGLDQKSLHFSPASYGRICSALQAILGDVDAYIVQEVGKYLVVQLRHVAPGSPLCELTQESDGTLRVLALLTALYQPALPSLLAIEEPELHLHPGAFRALAETIMEGAERTQVLITTQSPDLITEFDPKSLRIVEKREGKTEIGEIEAYQLEAINKELFTTGDLLRIEGLKSNGSSDDTLSSDDQTPSDS